MEVIRRVLILKVIKEVIQRVLILKVKMEVIRCDLILKVRIIGTKKWSGNLNICHGNIDRIPALHMLSISCRVVNASVFLQIPGKRF